MFSEYIIFSQTGSNTRITYEKPKEDISPCLLRNGKNRKEMSAEEMLKQLNLREDQLKKLQLKKVAEWSVETLSRALVIRASLGLRPYNFLRRKPEEEDINKHHKKRDGMNFPLPCVSTLNEFMEKNNLVLEPGIHEVAVKYIGKQIKADKTKQYAFCSILIDEMSITPNIKLHVTLQRAMGEVTVPSTGGDPVANKLFLVMARGISEDWLLPIAYHLTSSQLDAKLLRDFIFDCKIK